MVNRLFIVLLLVFSSVALFAKKMIVVDLTKQMAYAYENGREVFRGNVSTGKPGRRTPVGTFRVLEKDIDHVSSKYPRPNGGARMNYMLRLTNYGVAMHLGYVPNYPASHGCIRMENGFAQKMYYWAPVGTKVVIRGTPPRYVNRDSSSYREYYSSTSNNKRYIKRNSSINESLMVLSSVPGKKVELKKTRKTRSSRHRYQRISETERKKPLDMLKG